MTTEHKPYTDDGVTYCGWDGHDGCGEVWPCAAVRRGEALAIIDDPQLPPPVTITNRTRITLPECPGRVFVLAGLATNAARTQAEIHLVEEGEWRRRRIANGLPVGHLATPGAATGE